MAIPGIEWGWPFICIYTGRHVKSVKSIWALGRYRGYFENFSIAGYKGGMKLCEKKPVIYLFPCQIPYNHVITPGRVGAGWWWGGPTKLYTSLRVVKNYKSKLGWLNRFTLSLTGHHLFAFHHSFQPRIASLGVGTYTRWANTQWYFNSSSLLHVLAQWAHTRSGPHNAILR